MQKDDIINPYESIRENLCMYNIIKEYSPEKTVVLNQRHAVSGPFFGIVWCAQYRVAVTSSGAAQASTAGNTSGSVHCTLDVELMVGHRVFGNFDYLHIFCDLSVQLRGHHVV